jgi:hypothetical protein
MKNKIGGECGMHRREERCRFLVGKSQGKKERDHLRKPRYRWEINKNRFFSRTERCGLD